MTATRVDPLRNIAMSLANQLHEVSLERDRYRDVAARAVELVRQQRHDDIWLSQDQWNQSADELLRKAGAA
jgi:hypothetical protein